MSNWSLRNDHEVSVVMLMMGLYRTSRRDGGSIAISVGLIVNESIIFLTASTIK